MPLALEWYTAWSVRLYRITELLASTPGLPRQSHLCGCQAHVNLGSLGTGVRALALQYHHLVDAVYNYAVAQVATHNVVLYTATLYYKVSASLVPGCMCCSHLGMCLFIIIACDILDCSRTSSEGEGSALDSPRYVQS